MRAPAPRSYRGTPMRSLRLDDETWGRVTAHATERGVTASDIVRELIETLPERT